jgi:hypothetical protein
MPLLCRRGLQTQLKHPMKPGTFLAALFSFTLVSVFFALAPAAVFALSGASPLHTISINAPDGILKNPLTRTTIDDVRQLLTKGFPNASIRLNDPAADVQIVLPEIGPDQQAKRSASASHRRHHELSYPDHAYAWRSFIKGNWTVLKLDTSSCQGVSFGLYGLLQEKLGFRFYHPKQTIIPSHTVWPLPAVFRWKAMPRFEKNGFHVHTLHPIELTEQIQNPDYPHAIEDVREYLDWLARNQQNLFQFFLLRDVDRPRWISHAKAFTDYAHSRGILVGVEVSLSMLQQKAFQLVKLLRPWPYRRQVDASLAWLMTVPWDFVTVDFSMGEYQPNLGASMPGLRDHVVREIAERYHRKVMLTTHVIRDDKQRISAQPDQCAGILIHTVMCYSIEEPCAPVYGNANQRCMLERAKEEAQKRETWYWPESAYWVAFDDSVPLLLLPYLDARWSDMKAMEQLGVQGHLTFSSGWEWGYWLIDWSIARWSWNYEENGVPMPSDPLTRVRDLFPEKNTASLFEQARALQNAYLKDKGLMPFLAAADPSAELFWPFSAPFAPRMPFTYAWLLDTATEKEVDAVLHGPVALLEEYSRAMNKLVSKLQDRSNTYRGKRKELAQELTDALEITSMRAEHRSLTFRALISSRKGYRAGQDGKAALAAAAAVREQAKNIVTRREQGYRYPVDLIARERKDFTAYHFGYLYPVKDLHFWEREEEQVKKQRFDAFFMNIWNFRRIVGIGSLVW